MTDFEDPPPLELSETERVWLPRLDPWREPDLPIQDREFPLIPPTGCPGRCLMGECRRSWGDPYGCGGCCSCLGGCFALYEQRQTAPHVWTGDSA